MMYRNENLSYWVWASGFVLTERIPYELLDLESPDYDEEKLDEFILAHLTDEWELADADLVWDAIENLAWDACKTFTFKPEALIK
jgi:hypothetical protein